MTPDDLGEARPDQFTLATDHRDTMSTPQLDPSPRSKAAHPCPVGLANGCWRFWAVGRFL